MVVIVPTSSEAKAEEKQTSPMETAQGILVSMGGVLSDEEQVWFVEPKNFNAVPSFKNNLSSAYYCDANAPPLYKLYSQYLLYDKL